MEGNIRQQLIDMPKVVLHLHLDGSLRPATVQKWLQEQGKNLTLEEVTKMLTVGDNCESLNQYLEKFDLPLQVLQTKEHIEQATYELFADLAKQGVIYAEVRFAPCLHSQKGLAYEEIVKAAIKGMNKAKEEYKIKGNLILCCMRESDFAGKSALTVFEAYRFLGKGVCGIDLAGAEALFPTKDFQQIFEFAKRMKIPYTIHAGEADGPESVFAALDFGAKRIGHGVRCIESKELMGRLAQEEILLEVCPISNMQTKAVEGKHPLEKIYRSRIKTCINPDNDTVSNTDIIKEYEYVLAHSKLTLQDLIEMNKNAARGSFITPSENAKLVSQIDGFGRESTTPTKNDE